MALTRALPPCGDNTLADGGCLPTAAAETQVGPPWRRSLRVRRRVLRLVRTALQCGAKPASRRRSALQRRVTGGEPSAWSGRAATRNQAGHSTPTAAAPAGQASAGRTTQPCRGRSLRSAPAARARRLAIISAGWCGRLVGRSDPKGGRDGSKFVRPQDQLAQAANQDRIELRPAVSDAFGPLIAQIASYPPAASWLRPFQNRLGCKPPTFQVLGGASDVARLPLHRGGRGL
jgi:hypothetical protein